MRKNEAYSVEITGLTAEGAGVARVDGQVVFVPGVIPGERCKIKIDHVGRTCAYGVAGVGGKAVRASGNAGVRKFWTMRWMRVLAHGLRV